MRLEIFSYDFFIYIFYERMIYFIDVKLINYNSMDISISFFLKKKLKPLPCKENLKLKYKTNYFLAFLINM